MATKYGYVKRDPQDTQLNWSQIATDVTDMLQNEVKVREEKKAAIDQATRDYQEILNNVPQGENTQLNEFSLNAAEKLQKQMLMQETLLKSGQLNPKQYTIMRQNLQDGTDQAFGLLQDYNDEYAEKMAMMSSDLPVSQRASEMQTWMMEQVEGFANFTQTELVINPETGIMSMAKLIDDGSGNLIPDPNPNNLVTVQQLRNRIKTKYTQYDVIGGADEFINTLGTESKIIEDLGNKYKAGIFKTIKDIRDREGGFKDKTPAELANLAKEMGIQPSELKAYSLFEQSQITYINGQLSNPNFAASVLVDFMGQTFDGKDYTLTFDPEEAKNDPSVVLLKSVNGRVEAQLTDEQKKAAVEAYKSQIDIGLNYEETVQVSQVYREPRAMTSDERKAGERQRELDSKVSKIADLYKGDDMAIQGATDYFRDQNDNIQSVTRDEDGIVVTYTNVNTGELEERPVSFYVMEDNPDFDDTKDEGVGNERRIKKLYEATQADVDAGLANFVGEMIPKLKSQAEFIESAGPLLTGESDISKALSRGGYDKDAKFNRKGFTSSKVVKKDKPTIDYSTDIDNWAGNLVEDINIGDSGYTKSQGGAIFKLNKDDFGKRVVNKLNNTKGFEGVKYQALDGDKISLSIPGHPQKDPLVIEVDFLSDDDGAAQSLNSLKKWMMAYANDKKNQQKFIDANNWEGKKLDANGIPM